MKNLFCTVLIAGFFLPVAQSQMQARGGNSLSFIDFQKTFTRPDESFRKKEELLKKEFEAKKLIWPASYIYIRSFKYDSQMEVWVKDKMEDPFTLFKTYRVCALAGTLGPKRIEGDYQVPEGFYYINEFNPKSDYYLSLGLNYPNASDRILSDMYKPGGDIYIHGSCVTVGCIPVTDQQIDELYILAAYAKSQGQDFIPVHIFPIRFNVKRSVAYLANMTKEDPSLATFASTLEGAFNYFEKYKKLPVVLTSDKGEYIVDNAPVKTAPAVRKVKPGVVHRTRSIPTLVEAVHKWPEFPGGAPALMQWLDKVGKDMAAYLPEEVTKAYVQAEFIVDTDGVPVNFKILRGKQDAYFENEMLTQLEKMPNWSPAILHDKPVAKKMIQTVTVSK